MPTKECEKKFTLKYYLPTIGETPELSQTQSFVWDNAKKCYYIRAAFKGQYKEESYFNASATYKLYVDKTDPTKVNTKLVCVHNIKVEDEEDVDLTDKTTEYGYLYCVDTCPLDFLYYKKVKKEIYTQLKAFINNMEYVRDTTSGVTNLTLDITNTGFDRLKSTLQFYNKVLFLAIDSVASNIHYIVIALLFVIFYIKTEIMI